MNWLAAGLIVLGYLLIIWKNRWGFIAQMAGCSIYIINMWHVDLSVVFVNGVFWAVNLVGFIKWSTEFTPVTEGGEIVVDEVGHQR